MKTKFGHFIILAAIWHLSVKCQNPSISDGSKFSGPSYNNLALTPPMGFNTWNTFKGNPSEVVVRQIVDLIISNGFKDAGYQYMNIDYGWDKGRDANGQIIINTNKFPNGMKVVADYIHSKGLKAGIYTDLGKDKPGVLGSQGYFDQDMKTFASWGFDYIKVDVNNVKDRSEANLKNLFSQMSKAVKNCGRPMVFSICNQGDGNYTNWAPSLGNLWRVGKDIDYLSWIAPFQTTQWQGVIYELDLSMAHPEAARPGAWNDADMMLVGVNSGKLTLLNSEETRSHFLLWCVINSPLIIGADLRNISTEAKNILTNTEAIAINQDAYGQQARLVKNTDSLQVFSKCLESATSGKRGVVLFNRKSSASDITVNDVMLGLKGKFSVRDLWVKKNMGSFNSYTVNVPAHGVVMLKITTGSVKSRSTSKK